MTFAANDPFTAMQDEVAGWRRHLHTNPELMFDVHGTAGFVSGKLRAFGCDEVVEGIGRTGVVGVIRGRSTLSGKVVGLRADMDALPILEATSLPYASRTPGIMHACGHDGHTAMLLGAAKYLASTRNFDGTAIVVFQPAEEGGGGGLEMVEDGLMERFGIQEIYGLHNMPGAPVGSFLIAPGPFMAAVDTFTVDISGRGGHAAMPHLTVDATVAGCAVVGALQSLVSRNLDPRARAVVTVASIHTETASHNIIAQTIRLLGTVRTLDNETRDAIQLHFERIVYATAAAYGATVTIDYSRDYPVTVNWDEQTQFAANVAKRTSGECSKAEAIMAGEDFAFMLERRPGSIIFMGNGDSAALHHPEYDFNDAAIPAGCAYWAGLIETRMSIE